jgi:hypothetical protein
MKKTIKLTEKDLNYIVNKVIREQMEMESEMDDMTSRMQELLGDMEVGGSPEEMIEAINEKIYELKKLRFEIKSKRLKSSIDPFGN